MKENVKLDQGEWELGDPLGAGAFGTVYAAKSADGEPAAVKLIPRKPGFDREQHFANLTDVRNIVPIIASGEHGNQHVLVMPMAERSLQQYLTTARTPLLEEALQILIDVAETLTDLTPKEVVHRDLKPANILLLNGRWCLGDFGIARDLTAATATSTFRGVGSQAYQAPETWDYEPPTSATDIYSYGVMAYELLEGACPYEGPARHNYAEQHRRGEFPPLTKAPTILAGLVSECLLTAAQDRPTASEVLSRLNRAAHGLVGGSTSRQVPGVVADSGQTHVARPAAAPLDHKQHPGDAAKAARFLRLLPLDGFWLRWLSDAQTMFKVPLTVSDPVCDAQPLLKKDRPDYVALDLRDRHRVLVETLDALADELNGMTDISDEGPDVLEINYPGTSADRNELNRTACRARDQFIAAYDNMVNLLNTKGLLPSPPTDTLDISVELLGGRWSNGGVITGPFPLVAALPSTDPTAPFYFAVQAASHNNQGPQIAAVGVELIQPNGAAATYLFPARGPQRQSQLPFQLTAHGVGHALANAAEIATSIRILGSAGVTARPFAKTGSGQVFHGAGRPVADLSSFLDAALPPTAS
ncbi:serine/threonine-protein kinase [Streptomyces sp. ML-6]|uniref:serine/threonine-protein kinase n=1 Tax=Streptomyces sp. ML-6 TaxID=2982693 RepID=UPI0024BFBFA3|nr:serine/threonine-protein kinase [Streptomyces sp. ML-6]MDK0523497.1 serine/threonine protein kinase [Streptomyces sp. ML-6]